MTQIDEEARKKILEHYAQLAGAELSEFEAAAEKTGEDFKWVTVPKNIKEPIFAKPKWAYLNYHPNWRAGTKRYLPKELRQLLTSMGIVLAEPSADAKESIYPAQPTMPKSNPIDLEALEEKYRSEPRLRVALLEGTYYKGTVDGAFVHDLNISGYPSEWFLGEVREIPFTLFEKMRNRGLRVTAQPVEIENALLRGKQPRFNNIVNQWREEWAEKTSKSKTIEAANNLASAVRAEQEKYLEERQAEILERAKKTLEKKEN